MTPLVWTLAPLLVTLLAIVWVSWRSRPRRPGDPNDTIEEHQRFRAALARRVPQDRGQHGTGPDDRFGD